MKASESASTSAAEAWKASPEACRSLIGSAAYASMCDLPDGGIRFTLAAVRQQTWPLAIALVVGGGGAFSLGLWLLLHPSMHDARTYEAIPKDVVLLMMLGPLIVSLGLGRPARSPDRLGMWCWKPLRAGCARIAPSRVTTS